MGWVSSGHGFYKDLRPVGSGPVFENIIYFGGHLINNGGSGQNIFINDRSIRVGFFLWIWSDEENGSMRNSAEHVLLKGIEHVLHNYTNSNNFAFYITEGNILKLKLSTEFVLAGFEVIRRGRYCIYYFVR